MNHSESIVLSKKPLGEADLLVTLFSRDQGKIKGVAKHARRSKKRFAGLLENGYILNVDYSTSLHSELVKITQASLVMPLGAPHSSLEKTTSIWLALELANKFLADVDVSSDKYDLLKRFLKAIYEDRLTRQILLFYLVRWLTLCGYQPDPDDKDYKLSAKARDVLKKLVKGEIKFDIDKRTYKEMVGFLVQYCKFFLGKGLEIESYLPSILDMDL